MFVQELVDQLEPNHDDGLQYVGQKSSHRRKLSAQVYTGMRTYTGILPAFFHLVQ
jgi:hypothetical protein